MMPGYGDPETWNLCAGHPHDPRTPEDSDDLSNAREVCDEIRICLMVADQAVWRGDLKQFCAAMESAHRYLASMDFSGVSS